MAAQTLALQALLADGQLALRRQHSRGEQGSGQKQILEKPPAILEQRPDGSTNRGPRAQETQQGIHRRRGCLESPARSSLRMPLPVNEDSFLQRYRGHLDHPLHCAASVA
jgi:hypothetical protein